MLRALILLSFAAALAAGACGGSNNSSSTATPATTPPPTVAVTPTASTSITGCTPAEAEQALETYRNAQRTLDGFDDVRARANDASAEALPALIAELQQLSRDARAIELPACAQPSTGHLAGSIDGVVQALTDAQAGKPESDIQASADEARSRYELFKQDLANLLHDAALK